MIAIPKNFIEQLLWRYLRWMHGGGATHQYLFYRCRFCQRLVSHRAIARGGCLCGNNELIPAPLRFFDKVKALVLPWMIQH